MIEVGEIAPRLRRVACLAAELAARAVQRLHASGKLTVVGIGMAGGAAQVAEVEDSRAFTLWCFVAINAGYGRVPASQREARLLVPCNIERRVVEAILAVATLAAVEVRRSCKLVVVDILMAVEALRRLDAEYRCSSRRYMAFGAGYVGMFRSQRKVGFAVIRNCELRRLEPVE